jgi:hypothetical protein
VAQTGIRQKGGLGSVSNLDNKPGFSVIQRVRRRRPADGLKLILNNAQEDPTFVRARRLHVHRAAGNGSLTAHAVVTSTIGSTASTCSRAIADDS